MTIREKYIALIRKTPLMLGATIVLDNLDRAELIETERGIEVENEHGTQFHLEQLSLKEVKDFCFELNIEERMDYLIMTEDNQWISTGKFATQPEIDTEVEHIISGYDEDRPKFIVFTAEEMQSLTV